LLTTSTTNARRLNTGPGELRFGTLYASAIGAEPPTESKMETPIYVARAANTSDLMPGDNTKHINE